VSDFFGSGWSWFVLAATVASLVFCLVLLAIASRRRVMAEDNTTGHVWDADLRELNNPLPRWWMWLFVITVVFSAIYFAFYPGLGSYPGSLKWSSAGQFEAEQRRAAENLAKVYARFTPMTPEQIVADKEGQAIGQRLFLNNCASCHGSDAKGSRGFPNLADGDWLGAGDQAYVEKVIREGRIGNMPPMAAALGSPDNVRNVANYVLSLSGSPHNDIAAQKGKASFGTCAACHGADGKGNPLLGAPNLTDRTWLHGWGEAAIVNAVTAGLNNVMPPQGRLLTDEQVRVLAAYVRGLSGASAPKTADATAAAATR
jgi:cytochrome c oxidase cbb3-type subunit III